MFSKLPPVETPGRVVVSRCLLVEPRQNDDVVSV